MMNPTVVTKEPNKESDHLADMFPHLTSENFPPMGLETSEFRKAAHRIIDWTIDYHESLKCGRLPIPAVKPGFMKERLPNAGPAQKESWETVFGDVENVVLDGALHWLSSNYFGYFPTGISYPSMLGDMLCTSTANIGFSWASSPSCTELETVMMDWLAKALNLPDFFLHNGRGPGGGVIQGSASEATLITMLAARNKVTQEERSRDPKQSIHEITARMVAYASKYSHSSVERASKVALVNIRLLDVDENISLRGSILRNAIEEDRRQGKIPMFVCATIGTTACCAYDNILELGSICQNENIWLHVDAAYAGSALLCPEYRYIAQGLQSITSFNFNPHKWMMVNFDCSVLWVRNSLDIINSLNVNPVYLQHKDQTKAIDYRHWQISLGRRLRSIKLWFVMRMIGLEGLQHHIRKGVSQAKYFELLVRSDGRFEVVFPVTLGLVCFRLLSPDSTLEKTNELNSKLCEEIQRDRRYVLTPSSVNDVYFLRFSGGMNFCDVESVKGCWEHMREKADLVLHHCGDLKPKINSKV
ncbi:aromatic-L-amino-acid decarboxylase-like [Clavelina lepadiformis]|uniref:aromatic-L-amino-acid decarboxylase-like n=1 Tax=Clavelina lepadiformis TaxID=159417 RepID=UPI004042A73C